MTDQNIPAGLTRDQAQAVREWAERSYAAKVQDETMYHVARVLLAVLPKRPTLADMTSEDRRACQWMQADVAGHGTRYVIANPDDDGNEAELVSAEGEIAWIFPEYVTPRPDLPRMEWPGTGQDGEEATKVDYVSVAGGRTAYGPWTVARLRKKPDTVPPNTLAEGSEWDDADALARACEESGRDQIAVLEHDGWVYVWDATDECWEGSAQPDNAPYTIIHTGKKADQ